MCLLTNVLICQFDDSVFRLWSQTPKMCTSHMERKCLSKLETPGYSSANSERLENVHDFGDRRQGGDLRIPGLNFSPILFEIQGGAPL